MTMTVPHPLSKKELALQALRNLLIGFVLLSALFFLTAGTFRYWEAWLYLAVLFVPISLFFVYLINNAPDLLERRLRMREREKTQGWITGVAGIIMLLAFIIPGLDKRFGWSSVPPWVVIVADLVFLTGYGIFVIVLRENHYASRLIEVERDQKVISTGPYARVRHPMYVAVLLMYMASPLALGSFWAVLPTFLLPIILIARIQTEEIALKRDLQGYEAYTQQVRYRLIPGIW